MWRIFYSSIVTSCDFLLNIS